MNKNKGFVWIVAIVVIAAGLLGGAYYLGTKNKVAPIEPQPATQDRQVSANTPAPAEAKPEPVKVAALTEEQIKNAVVYSGTQALQLKNGIGGGGIEEGPGVEFSKVVFGDVNGDGMDDAVALFFFYNGHDVDGNPKELDIFLNKNGKPVWTANQLLDNGNDNLQVTDISISAGQIILSYTTGDNRYDRSRTSGTLKYSLQGSKIIGVK